MDSRDLIIAGGVLLIALYLINKKPQVVITSPQAQNGPDQISGAINNQAANVINTVGSAFTSSLGNLQDNGGY